MQDVAAFRNNIVNFTGAGIPEQLRAGEVTADYFPLLGAPVFRGRTFSAEEVRPGGERVVVLSHSFWRRRFGSDPGVIGTTLSLGGDPYTVIGIIGPAFDVGEFGPPLDMWVPFPLDPNSNDQGHYFRAAGRLKPGVALEQAKAQLDASSGAYRRKFPRALDDNESFSVTPFQEAFVSDVRQTLFVLARRRWLRLAHCVCKRGEFAAGARDGQKARDRGAFGDRSRPRPHYSAAADRERHALPCRWDSWPDRRFPWHTGAAGGQYRRASTPRDGRIAGRHGLARPRVCACRFGGDRNSVRPDSGPSWVAHDPERDAQGKQWALGHRIPSQQISFAARCGRDGAGAHPARGSALLIRTTLALRAVDPGYDANNVLTMRMSLSGSRFLQSGGVEQMVRDGRDRLQALPGVEPASATCCVPLEGGYGLPFNVVGRPQGKEPFHGGGSWATVSPGYFEVFKIPVRRGRTFTDRDTAGAPAVAIINEAMAKQFWKDGDPLNDRIVIGRGVMREFADEPERQIIGVVADSRDGD